MFYCDPMLYDVSRLNIGRFEVVVVKIAKGTALAANILRLRHMGIYMRRLRAHELCISTGVRQMRKRLIQVRTCTALCM